MSVAAYVRVSSKAQSTAMQVAAIERAAAARGDQVVAWYEEKRSGKSLARPELDRLRSDVRTGIVKRVYCFKLDRLTRSGVRDTFKVACELEACGCELIAVADNLHLKPTSDDLTSEVFLFALGLAARLEWVSISERISAARERIEAEGGRWGRPRRLKDAERARVQELKASGKSIRQISVAMRCPRATIARVLRPRAA